MSVSAKSIINHDGPNWYAGVTQKDAGILKAASKLALRGAHVSGGQVSAENHVYCDQPVRICMRTNPKDGGRTLEVSLWGPCRKCAKCLQFKQMRWRERIMNEIIACDDAGRRSWFITLTFAPLHLAGIIAEAGSSRQKAVEKAAYSHVKLYFKRLRKWGAKFRYCAVPEYGERRGRLHYHIILHEMGDRPLPKRVLQTQWRSLVHAKLVDSSNERGIGGAASYLSKYATKTLDCRPRASVRYGQSSAALDKGRKETGHTWTDTTNKFVEIYFGKSPQRGDVARPVGRISDANASIQTAERYSPATRQAAFPARTGSGAAFATEGRSAPCFTTIPPY